LQKYENVTKLSYNVQAIRLADIYRYIFMTLGHLHVTRNGVSSDLQCCNSKITEQKLFNLIYFRFL